MRGVLLVLVLAGCYAPDAPLGAPCGPGQTCPAGQTCVSAGDGDRCERGPGVDAALDPDAAIAPCAQPRNLALERPATTTGMTFSGSSPAEAVDGRTGVVGGYWACMGACSLVVDLGQDVTVEAVEVSPGGNALPAIYFLQRAWRVQRAEAGAEMAFGDFAGAVKETGDGVAGTGVSITNGLPPDYTMGTRYPTYETYRFRVAPTTARFIRFDGIEGDVDGDTNVDELAVIGCASP